MPVSSDQPESLQDISRLRQFIDVMYEGLVSKTAAVATMAGGVVLEQLANERAQFALMLGETPTTSTFVTAIGAAAAIGGGITSYGMSLAFGRNFPRTKTVRLMLDEQKRQ